MSIVNINSITGAGIKNAAKNIIDNRAHNFSGAK